MLAKNIGYKYGGTVYPESDWQLFKQCLNVWFDFKFADDSDYDHYREQLPFRFSRSKLALNIAALINQRKADVKDLQGFSKRLKIAVCALLGDMSYLKELGVEYF